MPARRDMLTGRLNFLERNRGPVEPFDVSLPELLRKKSVRSHMITDHYHYLELGGEGYCQAFDTWECFRGQEHDCLEWANTRYSPPPHRGHYDRYYHVNRKQFKVEKDFTTPKTFQAAAEWLERHGDEDDFLLWIEGFDPHEPFDTPKEFLEMYGDSYEGDEFIWPEYAPFDGSEEELKHIRNRYAATLTMTDRWIGKILDICDKRNLWEDTLIVFTTDHGYMLGEHGFMAKNYMPAYNEVFHIPLFVHAPGQKTEKRIHALTQNIDLYPTIAHHHGIERDEIEIPLHGKNLLPVMNGCIDSVREYVLYGIFGKSMNITDGRYTYFKSPADADNKPLNIYTAMPTTLRQYFGGDHISDYDAIGCGKFLPWTRFPVYSILAFPVIHASEDAVRVVDDSRGGFGYDDPEGNGGVQPIVLLGGSFEKEMLSKIVFGGVHRGTGRLGRHDIRCLPDEPAGREANDGAVVGPEDIPGIDTLVRFLVVTARIPIGPEGQYGAPNFRSLEAASGYRNDLQPAFFHGAHIDGGVAIDNDSVEEFQPGFRRKESPGQ
jgi:arylsulfatase A-like enzyme